MNDKHTLLGHARAAAQNAYDAAQLLEDYVGDYNNHLSSDDQAVLRNAINVARTNLTRLSALMAPFSAELETRKKLTLAKS